MTTVGNLFPCIDSDEDSPMNAGSSTSDAIPPARSAYHAKVSALLQMPCHVIFSAEIQRTR